MKKLFAIALCTILLLCAFPIAAFAEESIATEEQNDTVSENLPTTDENATEGEILGEEATPEPPDSNAVAPAPEENNSDESINITTELIVGYVKAHLEEISVIITLIFTAFCQVRKHGVLNKSIGVLNNNAVTVAENSNSAIQKALAEVEGVSAVVNGYKEEIALLLAEIRRNNEEKQNLETSLAEVHSHLKQAKLANVEFANELAELLVLANIPNSKKDELYARHLAAVNAISIAEAETMEVNADDIGQET